MPFETPLPPMADPTMPGPLISQMLELERWALANKQDVRRDTLRFWLLKIPAMLASVSAGILAYFQWDAPALFIGAIGSLCVLVDGVYPSGMLRNAHLRSVHDLRRLQHKIQADWASGYASLNKQGKNFDREFDKLSARVIESTHKEFERIADYVRDAEASLGTQVKSD